MRVAVITGPQRVELRDEPDTGPGTDEVLVAVDACGICTLERRLFSGEKPLYPVAAGHEVAGRVVAVGSAVDGLSGAPAVGDLVTCDFLTRCGTCIACRRGHSAICRHAQGGALSDGTVVMGGGLAELVRVPARQAFAVGDVPVEHAAMAEPLACVVHSLRRSGLRSGDRVAIIGGGYMGRLHLALARHHGAAVCGIVDVSAERRRDALHAGAQWALLPEEAVTRPSCADVVVVTAGAPGALELALRLVDAGGSVVLYGAFPQELRVVVEPNLLHHHEQSITGVWSQEPDDWVAAAALIRSRALAGDLEALLSARFTLDRVGDALRLATGAPVYRVLVGG